jgi:hypothetical protein
MSETEHVAAWVSDHGRGAVACVPGSIDEMFALGMIKDYFIA